MLSTLPRGFFRGLREALRGDVAGFARSVAILVGLLATTGGYLAGRAVVSTAPERGPSSQAARARALSAATVDFQCTDLKAS